VFLFILALDIKHNHRLHIEEDKQKTKHHWIIWRIKAVILNLR